MLQMIAMGKCLVSILEGSWMYFRCCMHYVHLISLFFATTSALSALEVLTTTALYKFSYLLTYLLVE